VVVQEPLEASDIKYRHDRLLREALEKGDSGAGLGSFCAACCPHPALSTGEERSALLTMPR
jgi:hypothetical protein